MSASKPFRGVVKQVAEYPGMKTGGTINRVTADISGESYPTSSWNSPR